MKQIRILTAIMLCASLFTACKKDETSGTGTAYSSVIDYNYTSVINYNLTPVLPAQGSAFKWSEGYVHTNGLIFNAFYKQGDAYFRKRFGAAAENTVSISNPMVLGSLKMPAITPDAASFTVGLNPSGSAHSLFLSGTYNTYNNNPNDLPNASTIPVQVMINDPVELNTQYLYNVAINKISYQASIEFSLALLTEDITSDMMNRVTITNGGILITSTSNANLYELIVNRLQNNSMKVQFSAQLFNTANPPVL